MSATFRDGYDIVTDSHYVMTPADFRDGCYTVVDAATGRIIGIGEHKLGYHVRTILDMPLCEGCDAPVPDDGVCHGCRQIHADLANLGLTDVRRDRDPDSGRERVAA
jgi:hypothetical protein